MYIIKERNIIFFTFYIFISLSTHAENGNTEQLFEKLSSVYPVKIYSENSGVHITWESSYVHYQKITDSEITNASQIAKNLSDNLTKAYIKLNKSKIISKKVNEYESGKKSNGLGYLSFNLMDNSTKYKTFISYIFIAEGEIIHQYNIHCSSIAERKFVENAVFKVMKK